MTTALESALLAHGRPTPCQGTNRDHWTSEDPDERAAAAEGCQWCPDAARVACLDAATAGRERWGVWAGLDHANPRQRQWKVNR